MAIVAVFQSPTLTKERYEETVRRLTGGKDKLTSPADWPVPGLLVHVAGPTANGFRVVDVWENEQSFARFGEMLMPILADVGVEGAPEIYASHTLVH